jgi:hypothetical protein
MEKRDLESPHQRDQEKPNNQNLVVVGILVREIRESGDLVVVGIRVRIVQDIEELVDLVELERMDMEKYSIERMEVHILTEMQGFRQVKKAMKIVGRFVLADLVEFPT